MFLNYKKEGLFFNMAMWWRIVYGFFRLVLGMSLLKVVGIPVSDLFYKLMSHELIQDPNDIFIQIVSPVVQHFSISVTYFTAFYLVFWGVLDIVLSILLLKKRIWAFPTTIFLVGIFILYELVRFAHTDSLILLGVIIVDIVVVTLIYREYKNQTAPKHGI